MSIQDLQWVVSAIGWGEKVSNELSWFPEICLYFPDVLVFKAAVKALRCIEACRSVIRSSVQWSASSGESKSSSQRFRCFEVLRAVMWVFGWAPGFIISSLYIYSAASRSSTELFGYLEVVRSVFKAACFLQKTYPWPHDSMIIEGNSMKSEDTTMSEKKNTMKKWE